MMHTGTWVFALAVAFATPLTVSAQPQSGRTPRNTQPAAPVHHPQSAIGRALAGLLQQVPASRATASHDVGATADAPRDAIATVPHAQNAPKEAAAGQVEVAVH